MYHIDSKVDKPDIGYMEAVVGNLMKRGIRLDDCQVLCKHYQDLRGALKYQIQSTYGIENPNSSVQIVSYIEYMSNQVSISSRNDILNICYDETTCKWTSKAEALEKLSDLGYEFAQDILDYRHAKKYAEAIESIMKAADENGLIHPVVSLGKTNRINYSAPALMNIPKKLLWYVIAPYTEGNILYSADIKNQEPSILINASGADELKFALESDDGLYETMFKQCMTPIATANILIDTFPENRVYSISEIKSIGTISPAMYSPTRPLSSSVYYNNELVVGIETVCVGSEKGLHAPLPSKVDIETEDGNIYSLDVEWESDVKHYKKSSDYTLTGKILGLDVRVSKAERNEFKTAWLAISYGASVFGIKNMCKIIDGKHVYNYITKIAGLKEYRSSIDKYAKALNTTIYTIFGNRLYAGDIDDPKKLKRVLLDLPIQGTGADILSLLIKHFYEYTKEYDLTDKIELYYTRHDELILEVNKKWNDEVGEEKVKEVLADMIEHQVNDWTPFKVEIDKVKSSEIKLDLDED